MQVQILVPSQLKKNQGISVSRDETVAAFRKLVAKTIGVSANSFLLIASGKIVSQKEREKELAIELSLDVRYVSR